MVKINEIVEYEGKKIKRLSLKRVKSLLVASYLFNRVENRKKIKLLLAPCKMNINNPFVNLFEIECEGIQDFEKWVNEYMYYNCNNEMGRYLHYYIEKK